MSEQPQQEGVCTWECDALGGYLVTAVVCVFVSKLPYGVESAAYWGGVEGVEGVEGGGGGWGGGGYLVTG